MLIFWGKKLRYFNSTILSLSMTFFFSEYSCMKKFGIRFRVLFWFLKYISTFYYSEIRSQANKILSNLFRTYNYVTFAQKCFVLTIGHPIYIIDFPSEKWVSVFSFFLCTIDIIDQFSKLIYLSLYTFCEPFISSLFIHSHVHVFSSPTEYNKRCTRSFLQQYSNKTEIFLPLSIQICGCIATLHIDYCRSCRSIEVYRSIKNMLQQFSKYYQLT